ncbi:hypothetical protein [Pectobacterium polaris]|uniref:hypothetical protein n=1 Tax=Pectobacterium polaris TaxID=2042057 RepID=UPI001968AEFE|nr:hypothetical protein [Pectobacterium polaris]
MAARKMWDGPDLDTSEATKGILADALYHDYLLLLQIRICIILQPCIVAFSAPEGCIHFDPYDLAVYRRSAGGVI